MLGDTLGRFGLLEVRVRLPGRGLTTTGELTWGRESREELSMDFRRCSFRNRGLFGGEEER